MSIQARKMEIGETIRFSDFIITSAFTKFGETEVVAFADKDGEIFRKVFSTALAKFLRDKKDCTSVTLEKIIHDGEYKFNKYVAN